MNTMNRGHHVLHINSAARNLAANLGHGGHHEIENLTTTAVLLPLLIVILTITILAAQYWMLSSNGQMPLDLPRFVDIPFALASVN